MQDNRREFISRLISFGVVPVFALDDAKEDEPYPGSANRFAHWALDLNGWVWPEAWGQPPAWVSYKLSLAGRARHDYRKPDYQKIMDICVLIAGGWKEVLRVHNVERLKHMTNDEFEAWADAGYPVRGGAVSPA